VGKIQRYMMEHLDEDIALDDIVSASSYSKYYAIIYLSIL